MFTYSRGPYDHDFAWLYQKYFKFVYSLASDKYLQMPISDKDFYA